MEPTNPPPPAARSFPFQAAAVGSQTSALMSESDVGCKVIAVRQWAGTAGALFAGEALPNRRGPAATDSANVMVAPGNAIDLSCSHDRCANAVHTVAAKKQAKMRVMPHLLPRRWSSPDRAQKRVDVRRMVP